VQKRGRKEIIRHWACKVPPPQKEKKRGGGVGFLVEKRGGEEGFRPPVKVKERKLWQVPSPIRRKRKKI